MSKILISITSTKLFLERFQIKQNVIEFQQVNLLEKRQTLLIILRLTICSIFTAGAG